MSKEAIKNLLMDFMADYDPNKWSNDDVYEKYAEKIDNVRSMGEIIAFTELSKKVKDLEHRLSNCIEPKFKIGQEIWDTITKNYWRIKRVEVHKFNGGCGEITIEIYRLGHDGTDDYNCCLFPEDGNRFFATEEEAKAKLREIQDGNNN